MWFWIYVITACLFGACEVRNEDERIKENGQKENFVYFFKFFVWVTLLMPFELLLRIFVRKG